MFILHIIYATKWIKYIISFRARAWAKYCWPSEDWSHAALLSLHNKTKVLCGRHFSHSQFFDNKRQKLSKFAVPDSPEVEDLLNTRENIFDPVCAPITLKPINDVMCKTPQ